MLMLQPWMLCQLGLPENVEVGDRIVAIVAGRENKRAPMACKMVMLTATEYGFVDDGGDYFSAEDGIYWSLERDILSQAMPTIHHGPCGACGRVVGLHTAEQTDVCAKLA